MRVRALLFVVRFGCSHVVQRVGSRDAPLALSGAWAFSMLRASLPAEARAQPSVSWEALGRGMVSVGWRWFQVNSVGFFDFKRFQEFTVVCK